MVVIPISDEDIHYILDYGSVIIPMVQHCYRADEAIVKELLCRWVSELEPAVAYEKGHIIGLTLADAQVGDKPFILRRTDVRQEHTRRPVVVVNGHHPTDRK